MSNNLPNFVGPIPPVIPSLRVALAVRRGQVDLSVHGVRSAVNQAKEQLDLYATADAARGSLNEELSLWEYGTARAGSDPVAQALVTRKVLAFADRNDRRITRRFG